MTTKQLVVPSIPQPKVEEPLAPEPVVKVKPPAEPKKIVFVKAPGDRWSVTFEGPVRQGDINHLVRAMRVEFNRSKRKARMTQRKSERLKETTSAA